MKFSDLQLCAEIQEAVSKKGYESPSPIQAEAIPAILKGQDVMAAAQTGTGKTAGFTLPILEKLSKGYPAKPNQVRALILTPTRELAAQVAQSVQDYGSKLNLSSTVVFGGVKINPQMMKLRKGVDILVATPGRLLDLHQQNAVRFNNLEILVLDEADRMLDMGFITDIKRILAVLPKRRQSLLFSATFSQEIRQLAKGLVREPVEISVAPPNSTVASVTHSLIPVDKKRKAELLIHLLHENHWQQVLVFTRTKHGANKLTKQLDKERLPAAAIHGNKSQGARTKALAQFKANKIQVLVATDIAARGIDISQLPYVINFDLPNVPEDYVHRIGRTGRAGASGNALSLVSADEFKQLSDIERVIKQLIDRNFIEGFEPDHDLPMSNLNRGKARAPRTAANKTNKPGQGKRKPKLGGAAGAGGGRKRPSGGNSNRMAKGSGDGSGEKTSSNRPKQNNSRKPAGAKSTRSKPSGTNAGKPSHHKNKSKPAKPSRTR